MWWRCESGFPRHPKTMTVLASEGGDRALLWWWFAGLWSVEQLTDGFIPAVVAKSIIPLRPGEEVETFLAPLVAARLLANRPDGWAIHNFTAYQPSARDVRKMRKQRMEAGRRGGLAKAKQTASKALATCQGSAVAKVCPDPIRSDTDHPPPTEEENKPAAGAAGCSVPPGDAPDDEGRPARRTWLTPYLEAYLAALNAWRAEVGSGSPPAVVGIDNVEKVDAAALAKHLAEAGKPPVDKVAARLREWLASTTEGSAAGGFLRLRDFVSWHKRRALVPDGARIPHRPADPDLEARRRQHIDPDAAWAGRRTTGKGGAT